MKSVLSLFAIALLVVVPVPTSASIWIHHTAQEDEEKKQPAVGTSAEAAHDAAQVAKRAATVANKVAEHSIKVTTHAKQALSHALGALHDARVDSVGMKEDQKDSLRKAEGHLREATKKADYGSLQKVKDDRQLQKEKMKEELDQKESVSEKKELQQEVDELRERVSGKGMKKRHMRENLDHLESDIEKNQANDETKARLERLRERADKLEKKEEGQLKNAEQREEAQEAAEQTAVKDEGIDIDTKMPYGNLEPFGREDTAQELTESSILESDEMVDQLERAEVAEEKRAVFRALTRLRGAAITAFDGVARSQTGNIDEYGKTHKWRSVHPVTHLANEESDIKRWAFHNSYDMLQLTVRR